MPGTLFVVATPIGNLEDLTFRALRVLREVDLIAAEDTRRTAKLLAHYDVHTPMVSLHEHNEYREAPRLVARLAAGETIALVTDAGTPGISDPGSGLVARARAAGIQVTPVPGPSAVTAALSAAGVVAPTFVFLGFPPHGSGQRDRWFEELAEEPRPVVFFEAPHRIADTIGRLTHLKHPRSASVFCEMTKAFERVLTGVTSQLADTPLVARGEFAIVLGAKESPEHDTDRKARAVDMVGQLTSGSPLAVESAIEVTASHLRIPVSTVRNAVRRAGILAKQHKE